MTIDDVLPRLGLDPAELTPARPGTSTGRRRPVSVGARARVRAAVSRPALRASSTFPVTAAGGWTCRDCFLATVDLEPSRVPGTVDGIVADLRAAAAEAGVQLTVVIDDRGGCRG
ncbi:hypothetical protein ACWDSD_27120 [Streptomyces spiralis]